MMVYGFFFEQKALLSCTDGKRHCGRAEKASASQNGANSEVGDGGGANSVKVGWGVTVRVGLAVGNEGGTVGWEAGNLHPARTMPNKAVKMNNFAKIFTPILLENRLVCLLAQTCTLDYKRIDPNHQTGSLFTA